MGLRSDFLDELATVDGRGRGTEPTPSELCSMATRVVGLSAAGLVMSHRLLRVPIGASDADSALAEQVEAGLGAGPCLEAELGGSAFAANAAELGVLWPVYQRELVRLTPFRSTLSFPLQTAGLAFGALDCYSTGTSWAPVDQLVTIQTQVVDLIALLLLGQVSSGGGLPPEWGDGRRGQVWMAVGMMRAATEGSSDGEAVALLRGHAFSRELLLDEVADLMVTGLLTTAEVLDRS